MLIGSGECMPEMTLQYPVHTLDGQLLMPAGAVLNDRALAEIAARANNTSPPHPLLQYGRVREDLLYFLDNPAYHNIFNHPTKISNLLQSMAAIHLALPCLETIEYFHQHDICTYRHMLMVFALTTLLSNDLLPDSEDRIRESLASPTHDIGKICVPLHILKKRTPLTYAERQHLNHHPQAGSVLLSHYLGDHRRLAVTVARDHHERRDGSGYPRGIHARDPLTEIIIVCDIYDALVSPRPYRPISFDNRTAIEEITRLAEKGEIGWYVVKALVAHNRDVPFDTTKVWVSPEKRGVQPAGNLYGQYLDAAYDETQA